MFGDLGREKKKIQEKKTHTKSPARPVGRRFVNSSGRFFPPGQISSPGFPIRFAGFFRPTRFRPQDSPSDSQVFSARPDFVPRIPHQIRRFFPPARPVGQIRKFERQVFSARPDFVPRFPIRFRPQIPHQVFRIQIFRVQIFRQIFRVQIPRQVLRQVRRFTEKADSSLRNSTLLRVCVLSPPPHGPPDS